MQVRHLEPHVGKRRNLLERNDADTIQQLLHRQRDELGEMLEQNRLQLSVRAVEIVLRICIDRQEIINYVL